MIAIKSGDVPNILNLLYQSQVVFGIFSVHTYMECVSVQLMLLEYYNHVGHPYLELFADCSESLNGEDIVRESFTS